jgi:hypothetical protein
LGRVNPIGIRSCYDEGKRCAETLFFDYQRQHGLDIKVARLFNTYGPRMHPDDGRVVSNFIMQALRGEDLTIYGDGLQTRSFCYVDDLIEGMLRFMNSPEPLCGPLNLGNPAEFTMLELAEQVLRVGGRSRLVFRPLPGTIPAPPARDRLARPRWAGAPGRWAGSGADNRLFQAVDGGPRMIDARSELVVVTPVYEDAEAFARLCQDLAAQFGRAVFVVAVDDGSVARPLDIKGLVLAGVDGWCCSCGAIWGTRARWPWVWPMWPNNCNPRSGWC